jgi:hypothetical protein
LLTNLNKFPLSCIIDSRICSTNYFILYFISWPRIVINEMKFCIFTNFRHNLLMDDFFQQNVCNKSHVVTIEGRKIGIIGYVTPDTKFISKPGLNEKCPQLKEQQ